MEKLLLLLFGLLVFSPTVFPQTFAKGYVYEDGNTNGLKDQKEKGIQGVAVCNGVEITLTDGNGFYQLPVGDDNILFVIKPSGYKLPLNSKNQPQFYYTHKPKGSPGFFKYKGTKPTGKLPDLVNFALLPAKEENGFTALIFGDPQVYTAEEVEYFSRSIISELKGIQGVKFGLSLGDLVGDSLDLHRPYIDAISKVGIPWYNVIGNHDLNFEDASADSLSDETFEANFGPANYAFNYGNVHFVILDNILHPHPNGSKNGYTGGLRPDQFDFLENDLKLVSKEKLIVLAFHIPLKGNGFRAEDRRRLFNILKDFPYTLSLSAHTHIQRQDFFRNEDGFHRTKPHHEYNVGTTCGSWWSGQFDTQGIPDARMTDGTPKGYAFLHINGNGYTIDYKVAGEPASYQIEVFLPKVIPYNQWTSSLVYANFFMGKEGDTVRYRFDGGEWKDMIFTQEIDPTFSALLYPWDTTEHLMPGRRPNEAVKSTHLWKGPFPYPWEKETLSIGGHTVEIKATDMFGKTFTTKKGFRVERPVKTNP